jgi:hypothetical protein
MRRIMKITKLTWTSRTFRISPIVMMRRKKRKKKRRKKKKMKRRKC